MRSGLVSVSVIGWTKAFVSTPIVKRTKRMMKVVIMDFPMMSVINKNIIVK